jgi:hypothetical protein
MQRLFKAKEHVLKTGLLRHGTKATSMPRTGTWVHINFLLHAAYTREYPSHITRNLLIRPYFQLSQPSQVQHLFHKRRRLGRIFRICAVCMIYNREAITNQVLGMAERNFPSIQRRRERFPLVRIPKQYHSRHSLDNGLRQPIRSFMRDLRTLTANPLALSKCREGGHA